MSIRGLFFLSFESMGEMTMSYKREVLLGINTPPCSSNVVWSLVLVFWSLVYPTMCPSKDQRILGLFFSFSLKTVIEALCETFSFMTPSLTDLDYWRVPPYSFTLHRGEWNPCKSCSRWEILKDEISAGMNENPRHICCSYSEVNDPKKISCNRLCCQ